MIITVLVILWFDSVSDCILVVSGPSLCAGGILDLIVFDVPDMNKGTEGRPDGSSDHSHISIALNLLLGPLAIILSLRLS